MKTINYLDGFAGALTVEDHTFTPGYNVVREELLSNFFVAWMLSNGHFVLVPDPIENKETIVEEKAEEQTAEETVAPKIARKVK